MDLDAEREEIERHLRQEFENRLPAIIEKRVAQFEEEIEEELREEFDNGLDDAVENRLEELLKDEPE